MFPKLLSMLSGGLVSLAWLLGSGNPATAAGDHRNVTTVQIESAVATTDSPSVQFVDHRRRHRHYYRDRDFGVSIQLGSPGYYSYYPPSGYYYESPRYYYPPRRYYDTGYRSYDPYSGSYYYYRW